MSGGYIFKEYDRVKDLRTGKLGTIVYISEDNDFSFDAYIFEPADHSFDPDWRYFDELELVK